MSFAHTEGRLLDEIPASAKGHTQRAAEQRPAPVNKFKDIMDATQLPFIRGNRSSR